MKFKVGDQVQVLDDDISGVIKKITQHLIEIETTDGFTLQFPKEELILEQSSIKLNNFLSAKNALEMMAYKEQRPKRQYKKQKAKEKSQPTFEVDLHINQLVNSTKNMTNFDMLNLQLDTAKRQLDFAIQKRIQKMVFIHGVGDGVLRAELETLLNRYDNLKFYDANYQKYGLGATEVYIYQNA